jgi:hypothetical protein
MRSLTYLLSAALLVACAGTDDLSGVALKPPLDRAVLVSGGAFFSPLAGSAGTFRSSDDAGARRDQGVSQEAIPFAQIVDVLERGRVFQRMVADSDPVRRSRLRAQLAEREPGLGLAAFLQRSREAGFDLLLLVEELRDGPIETQGTNNRWPVTFATWILLGVGALIPDRTFESRATLKVSLRDLQTGALLLSVPIGPGPVELALTERTDFLGLVSSIIVPPFWVGDDQDAVIDSVRTTTERRLLVRLVRELKSEVFRRSLDDTGPASIQLLDGPAGPRVVVDSRESLSVVRIDGPGYRDPATIEEFGRDLIASREIQGARFRYSAPLPEAAIRGAFQIKVGTLRGGVASATFTLESAR